MGRSPEKAAWGELYPLQGVSRGYEIIMNALDIVIGIILVFGLVRGIFRGLMEEVASIIGIFGGIYGAVFYYPAAAGFLGRWIHNSAYANIIGFLLIFGLIFFLVGLLGVLIKYLLNIASLGWFDRMCGAGFGVVKGILIVSVLLFALTTFLPTGTPIIKTSRLAPHVAVITESLVKIIPQDLKKRFSDKYREMKQEWEKKT
jgi:membrane protein required for colicin V production